MLESAFARRYPLEAHRACRERGLALCRQHLANGLADDQAETRLCAPDDAPYWQQLSEILAADQLTKAGLSLSHAGAGPDFCIDDNGRRIWVEMICPEPTGIPQDWLHQQPGTGKIYSVPHEAMLLRWTAAIKEKAEKLIGSAKNPEGYLAKAMVGASDIYVIAINGRLLRDNFPHLEGVSQFPFAVEATFCVGPYTINISRETLETVGSGHQHRPLIPKPNGSNVPADTFLDPRFAPISAIWALDIDENLLFDRPCPMAVVHNPGAINPLPQALLPAHCEYVATSESEHYRLERVDGRFLRAASS